MKPYAPIRCSEWSDPDTTKYKVASAAIFGLALFGRHWCKSNGLPRIQFTANALLVPIMYYIAIHHKEKWFTYDSSERKTFEQDLEFYPVTRRAWNRALAIWKAEIEALKAGHINAATE